MSLRIHPAGTKVFPLNNTGLSLGVIASVTPPTGGTLAMTNFAQLPIGAGGNIMSTDAVDNGDGTQTRVIRTDTNGCYKWDTSLYSGHGGWKLMTNSNSLPMASFDPRFSPGATALAMSHNNSQIMYLAIWDTLMRTTNGGTSWAIVNQPGGFNQQTSVDWSGKNSSGNKLSISRLAIDPVNDDHVLYGTQESGLWRTTDGGGSWTQMTSIPIGDVTTGNGVNCVAFDPTSPLTTGNPQFTKNIAVVVDGDPSTDSAGVYYTTDACATWTLDTDPSITGLMSNMGTGYIRELQYTPNGHLFAIQTLPSGNQKGYIWRRDSGTTTWSNVRPSNNNWGPISIDPHAMGAGGRIFSFSDGGIGNNDTIAYSTDWGDSWTQPTSGNTTMIDSGYDIGWMYTEFYNGGNMTRKKTTFDPIVANRMYQGEGVGVWQIDIGDDGSGNITIQYQAMARGIEQLVANVVVPVPEPTADEGVAVVVGGWDRAVFRNINRHNWPTGHYVSDFFTSAWSLTAAGSDPRFLAVSMGSQQSEGAGAGLKYSGWSNDGGTNWHKFNSLPALIAGTDGQGNPIAAEPHPTINQTTGDYDDPQPMAGHWGFGQIEVGYSPDHMVWIPGGANARKVPHYTTDRGDTWSQLVINNPDYDPNDSSSKPVFLGASYFNVDFNFKRRICAAAPDVNGTFWVYVNNSGFYKTTDITDVANHPWTRVCDTSDGTKWPPHGQGYDGSYQAKLYALGNNELWFTFGPLSAGSGLGPDLTTPLLRSIDGGSSWTQVSMTNVYALGFGPALPGATGSTKTLACHGYNNGTDFGWYISTNDGDAWTKFDPYPNGVIANGHDVAGDAHIPGRFYAATGGIGWLYFDIDLV